MKWTAQQSQVISLRDRSLLVSAAAGSGKTAVLIERILQKIMDKDHPLDLDRLLVMTFTRAAAGEMKERLLKALEKALEENPGQEHLMRQMNLVHTAQITTIDGFCSWLIKNYFHLIGQDPAFRVADEGELRLLKEEVLDNLLEDCYQQETPEFHALIEKYSPGKNDKPVQGMILSLYEASVSSPYPLAWLRQCGGVFEIDSEKELSESSLVETLTGLSRSLLEDCVELLTMACQISSQPDGPGAYLPALEADLKAAQQLLTLLEEGKSQEAVQVSKDLPAPKILSRKSQPLCTDENKSLVKSLRDEAKKIFTDLRANYLSKTPSEILEDLSSCRVPARELIRLTLEFSSRYAAAKKEKSILDFSDMEHFALAILQEENGEKRNAARELSLRFDEVMIDEYQDSNLVQETIAQAVSGWAKDKKNLFMVGDVKQSIYRFRQARPELFMEKYASFSQGDSLEQRIDLTQNFRSRAQVLDSCNFLFRQLLGADLGGVEYDKNAELNVGASFAPYPQGHSPSEAVTEVLLLDPLMEEEKEVLEEAREAFKREEDAGDLDTDALSQEELSRIEYEATLVAQRILELEGSYPVWDKEKEEYRPARLGDMVILLRSTSGWAETFSKVLGERGIPTYSASRSGYFSAPEIVTVLNYLRIVDNPRQDIPLAGVLRSCLVGLESEELALLRSYTREGLLFDCVTQFVEGDVSSLMNLGVGKEELERLKAKLSSFLSTLSEFRSLAVYTPVHELIQLVLEKTGYGTIAAALPGGVQRRANLSMLVEKALAFEQTSFRGLFRFLRYMEHLKKYEVDFGEANLSVEGERCVQIMTIHKSKGLEFPIVFVSGLGKRINLQDLNESVLSHPELGLGMDVVDEEKRIESRGVTKTLLKRRIREETLGEELRVLYVALTRAKEKLILTGCQNHLDQKLSKLRTASHYQGWLLPFRTRFHASTYLDLLLPALCRHRDIQPLLDSLDLPSLEIDPLLASDPSRFLMRAFAPTDLIYGETKREVKRAALKEALLSFDKDTVSNPQIREELTKRFTFIYPKEYLFTLPIKVSVSELKKKSYEASQEEIITPAQAIPEPEVFPLIPDFIQEKKTVLTGSDRGTAYHRLMECLDYEALERVWDKHPSNEDLKEEILRQLHGLVEEKRMNQAQADSIRPEDILTFLKNPVGRRLSQAGERRELRREQPFVFSRKARELSPEWPYEDKVLIQGIIDAYFFEEGEIVLLDYKTDRVFPGQEEVLIDRYRIQLEDYAAALQSMTGCRVKESYLYAFALGRELRV